MAVPANRTKFQYWNGNFYSKLQREEITSEEDQSLRKKKPREFRKVFSGNSGVQQGLLEANNNFVRLSSVIAKARG